VSVSQGLFRSLLLSRRFDATRRADARGCAKKQKRRAITPRNVIRDPRRASDAEMIAAGSVGFLEEAVGVARALREFRLRRARTSAADAPMPKSVKAVPKLFRGAATRGLPRSPQALAKAACGERLVTCISVVASIGTLS
jgi:hypothetical protein